MESGEHRGSGSRGHTHDLQRGRGPIARLLQGSHAVEELNSALLYALHRLRGDRVPSSLQYLARGR